MIHATHGVIKCKEGLKIRINKTRDLKYGNRVCVLFRDRDLMPNDLYKKYGCRTSSAGNHYFTGVLDKDFYEKCIPSYLKNGKDVTVRELIFHKDYFDSETVIDLIETDDHIFMSNEYMKLLYGNGGIETSYLEKRMDNKAKDELKAPKDMELTVKDVFNTFNTFNEAQKNVVYLMIGEALKENGVSYALPIIPEVKDVLYNDPATIIFWNDGSKTIVKCSKDEKYDPEKGLAMAVCKKVFGNEYKKIFHQFVSKRQIVKSEIAIENGKNGLRGMTMGPDGVYEI